MGKCQIDKMWNWQSNCHNIVLLAFVRPKIDSWHLSDQKLPPGICLLTLDLIFQLWSWIKWSPFSQIFPCSGGSPFLTESHSQAGSTTLGPQYKTSRFLAIYCPTSKSQGWSSINIAQLRDAKGRHHSWKKDFFWNHFIKWWPPPVPLLWSPYLFIFSSTFWAKKIDDFEGCLKGVVDGCFKGVWSVFGKIK